jgi:phospho-N-acetylmuramoyl-pentapeptide-transferase
VNPLVLLSIALVPMTAFLSLAFARWMRHQSIGQRIREVGPASHAVKAGTPTMGGAVVLAVWIAAVAGLWRVFPATPYAGFLLASGVLFGGIGALDDVISLRRRRSLGLLPLGKIALISLATLVLFISFRDVLSVPAKVPFSNLMVPVPRTASFFLAWFVFLATTNGMNLTDGLDGLATGVSILSLGGVLVLVPSQENLAIIVPLLAVLVGFLWVNTYPAALFLGDVGSFALGGVLAAVSLANGIVFLLPFLAGVVVLEVGSVVVQVTCYKSTGKRLFRMSPLHHHFEVTGPARGIHLLPAVQWPEPKITLRFWILQALFVGLAVLADRLAS